MSFIEFHSTNCRSCVFFNQNPRSWLSWFSSSTHPSGCPSCQPTDGSHGEVILWLCFGFLSGDFCRVLWTRETQPPGVRNGPPYKIDMGWNITITVITIYHHLSCWETKQFWNDRISTWFNPSIESWNLRCDSDRTKMIDFLGHPKKIFDDIVFQKIYEEIQKRFILLWLLGLLDYVLLYLNHMTPKNYKTLQY